MAVALARPAELTWQQLFIMVSGRWLFNTAFRLIYPLLTLLAAGLQVDLRAASLLITVQVGATLFSPIGGSLADSWGERRTMLAGMALFCAGCLVCAFVATFWPFLFGNLLIGSGVALYNPAVQSYASARSDYARRGRVLGILELSWALSALVGVALFAWLIDRWGGWMPAYLVMSALGVVLLGLILTLPPDRNHSARLTVDGLPTPPLTPIWRLDRTTLSRVAGIMVFIFCALMGFEMVLIVYAGWLEADFQATIEQLGLVFGLIGAIELGGSLGATLFVDRIGKLRSVLGGFAGVAILQLLLPVSSGRWLLFLVLFLTFHLFFEYGIVSVFPLVSELAPAARGTVIALSIAMAGLGRVGGSLLGPPVWERFGFTANSLLGCAIVLVGLAICAAFVRENIY